LFTQGGLVCYQVKLRSKVGRKRLSNLVPPLLYPNPACNTLRQRENLAVTYESGDSARAQLIRTRRGTWIDKSLLPAARQECLEILQTASEAVSEDVVEMARSAIVGDGFVTLHEEVLKYRLPEEAKAWSLAHDGHETAETCGCCGCELTAREPAYFGAEVYVGMWPLFWDHIKKPQICKVHYVRTVLCGSCVPEWLSAERGDVATQLCAYCERPMISRLELSELQNAFCSARCQRAYHKQLRKDKREEELKKARKKRAEERNKACEVCGKEFTATRRDAKTCPGGACKQKAYRRRKKEVRQNQ
jgi:hypothetical protein